MISTSTQSSLLHQPVLPAPQNAIDNEMIEGLRNRVPAAFDQLYNRYSAALYGSIKARLLSETLSTMVLQNTLKSIVANIQFYYYEKESFFIWCHKIAMKEVSRQKINLLFRNVVQPY